MLGDWELAHICLGASISDDAVARFAEASAGARGFIWQRRDEMPEVEAPWRVVDLSTWRDVESLVAALAQARDKKQHLVSAVFWVPVGERPDVDEARERWDQLQSGDPHYWRWEPFSLSRPLAPPARRPFRTHSGEWSEADPEAPWIERAPDRLAVCAVCENQIDKGDTRVTETSVIDGRGRIARSAYHFDCAIEMRPRLVQELLTTRRIEMIADAKPLYHRINERIAILDGEARDAANAKLSTGASTDAMLESLLVQLEADPADRGTLAVLADAFMERGDPRGELIAIQLADANVARRDELREKLSLPLPSTEPGNSVTWGIGFIQRLDLGPRTSERIALLGALWQHPSLRVLQHLVTGANRATEALIASHPRALRRLELVGGFPLGEIGQLVALLPYLESLHLGGRGGRALAHERLHTLYLSADALATALDPDALPALTTLQLSVRERPTGLIARLCAAWGERMPRLEIRGWAVDLSAAESLRDQLGSSRLPALDLTGSAVEDAAIEPLRHLTDELVVPKRAFRDAVRHRNKPEWGTGTILRRFDNKLEVEFAGIGIKVFRADAPFLEPA